MQRGPLTASLPADHMAPGGTTVADAMYDVKSTLWSSTMKDSCPQVIQSLSSVQLLSCVWFFITSWTAARQASLSITNSQSLLRLISIESLKPFNHLIPCCPLFLPPSSIRSISSVQLNCSVVHFLRLHEPQHVRPPCPSPTAGVYPNSCPLSRWCHPTISFSVISFSYCPQSFPASGSFPMSQLFASDGQSFGVSASTSVLPMNTQDWSPLEWTGWISLQSKGLSRVFSNTTVQKHQFFGDQLSL